MALFFNLDHVLNITVNLSQGWATHVRGGVSAGFREDLLITQ